MPPPAPMTPLATLAQLVCEVEAGARPVAHLRPFTDTHAYRQLIAGLVRPGPVPRVVRVHADRRSPDHIECVAILQRPDRVTALVMVLRFADGGWVVEELARPEDGHGLGSDDDRRPGPSAVAAA